MRDNKQTKWSYALDNKRFYIIAVILFLIFLIFMGVVIWQGENIRKNPCSICAERQGEAVVCTLVGGSGLQRVFETNGTIRDKFIGED